MFRVPLKPEVPAVALAPPESSKGDLPPAAPEATESVAAPKPVDPAGKPAAKAPEQPAAGSMMGAMMGMRGMGGMMGGGTDPRSSANAANRQIRPQIAALAAALAAREGDPLSKVVLKKLEEPISMSFADETPLDDVLKYIRQATTTPTYAGIPIYVDPKGLEEAKATSTYVVKLDIEGIPLKTTLRLVLKQIGLAYCVRDGVLIISSVQGIDEELKEAQAKSTE